ncbi:hypothetical protein LOD99_2597 [Oopsacas minuta]|uniref:PH domain-containing protein n=1 Tax=Oopsacas minuta TaxID=111878 RepID=A0AAV7K0H5_9METZ|nr:hypothetical protein LOD99_2597 [Oopsacas minuta]
MYYSQFEDEALLQAGRETSYKQGILTTRTKKGDWRARWFNLTDKSIQVVNKKPRNDIVEQFVTLKEIELIQYPVSLSQGEGKFDLNNKSNYSATFGIQYIDRMDDNRKKLIAYASNVEECRKWVLYLKSFINKYREGRLDEISEYSDSLELSNEEKVHLEVSAKVYLYEKKAWGDRKVTLENGAMKFYNTKGKLKDEFYLSHVHDMGYPSQVRGGQSPPPYIATLKCMAFRIQSSLHTFSTCTMYIHKAEDSKHWRETIKSILEGQN